MKNREGNKKCASKAQRGLFVLQLRRSIFTTISISLGICLRQWGIRGAIHTGQQLIGYWLRYIITVRVTAAI